MVSNIQMWVLPLRSCSPSTCFIWGKGDLGFRTRIKLPGEVWKGKYVRRTNMLRLFQFIDQVSARFGKFSYNTNLWSTSNKLKNVNWRNLERKCIKRNKTKCVHKKKSFWLKTSLSNTCSCRVWCADQHLAYMKLCLRSFEKMKCFIILQFFMMVELSTNTRLNNWEIFLFPKVVSFSTNTANIFFREFVVFPFFTRVFFSLWSFMTVIYRCHFKTIAANMY